jgi:TPP-dependent 2-oxoacid decarboxylase
MKLLGDSTQLPINFKNPFSKTKIKTINISMRTSLFDETHKYWTGYIEFKNGNTQGKQDFESKDVENGFAIITKEIQTFINSL